VLADTRKDRTARQHAQWRHQADALNCGECSLVGIIIILNMFCMPVTRLQLGGACLIRVGVLHIKIVQSNY
jgi:hypothetical protein